MRGVFTKVEVGIIVGLLVLIPTVIWFKASMEAKTYNRLTGSNVTTWEAVWVQLRLDGDR